MKYKLCQTSAAEPSTQHTDEQDLGHVKLAWIRAHTKELTWIRAQPFSALMNIAAASNGAQVLVATSSDSAHPASNIIDGYLP